MMMPLTAWRFYIIFPSYRFRTNQSEAMDLFINVLFEYSKFTPTFEKSSSSIKISLWSINIMWLMSTSCLGYLTNFSAGIKVWKCVGEDRENVWTHLYYPCNNYTYLQHDCEHNMLIFIIKSVNLMTILYHFLKKGRQSNI